MTEHNSEKMSTSTETVQNDMMLPMQAEEGEQRVALNPLLTALVVTGSF